MQKIIRQSAVIALFCTSAVFFTSNTLADQAAVTALNQAGIVLTDEEYFALLRAEPAQVGDVAAAMLAKRSTSDPALVASVVETLVAEFPDYAVAITESVVKATPSMAAAAVAAAVKAAPLQTLDIVAAAVAAAPTYARSIAAAAVATAPQMAQQIVQAALTAAPEQSAAINAGANDGSRQAANESGGGDETASGPSTVSPGQNETGGNGGGDTNGSASPS